MTFFQEFRTETKLLLVVALAAVILAAGGIWLLKGVGLEPSSPSPPPPAPAPSPQAQTEEVDISAWQIYRNDEYGFEVKYPSELSVTAEGSNSAQEALNNGQQISGTIIPSFDAIHFIDSDSNPKLSIGIFDQPRAALSEQGYKDEYLYLYGPCDLRGGFEPQQINKQQVYGIPALQVIGDSLTCVYFSNPRGYLLVVSSVSLELLNQLLSTFQLVQSGNTWSVDLSSWQDASTWETYTNSQYGFEVRYPTNYPGFISSTSEFKPDVTVFSNESNLICSNNQKEVSINNHSYCVETASGGAGLGTSYEIFMYTTTKEMKKVQLRLTLAFSTCENYPPGQLREECYVTQEYTSENVDLLADQILSTFRFVE